MNQYCPKMIRKNVYLLSICLICLSFLGCTESSDRAPDYAELVVSRSSDMDRFFTWRHGVDQSEVFTTQAMLAEYLDVEHYGEGEVLFPVVASLVEQGWKLVGVSGHSSASIVEGDSVIVDEPYSVTYHFYRK